MAIFYQSGAYCPDTHRQMKEISCSVNNTTKAKFWIIVLEGENRVPDGGVNLLARSAGCDGSIFLNSLKFFFKWLFTVFSITNKES
jgi:hypothetical protein